MEIELGRFVIWEVEVRRKSVVWGVNGVAMDRHGLTLWENEATGSRKVFKYLLDLRDAMFFKELPDISKNQQIHMFPYIYILPIYRLGG